MENINVEFKFNDSLFYIQCLKEDKMKTICYKIASKIKEDINLLEFYISIYGSDEEKIKNFELTYQQLANLKNTIKFRILIKKKESKGIDFISTGIISKKNIIRNEDLMFFPQIELKFNKVNFINEKIFSELKSEIKNYLGITDFSIIEIKKGSLLVILALQYIIKNLIKEFNIFINSKKIYTKVNQELKELCIKLEEHQFTSLGSIKPNTVSNYFINITEESNQKKIKEKILNISQNSEKSYYKNSIINLYEASKNISDKDIEIFFDELNSKAMEQENLQKKIIPNLDEFNKVFDLEIEKALKNSIFEYKIIHILFIDKNAEEYLREKKKCPNQEQKLLFHGTNINSAIGILSSEFRKARVHIFGEGVYFTDMLDYAWYYAGEERRKNFNNIPKIDECFSVVVSEVYYDKTKIEKVYNTNSEDIPVVKNGIRCAYANYKSRIMKENEIKGYYGFIGNEFLITNRQQILPLYGITFRRVTYLVIWRDPNINPKNPNNYNNVIFNEIQIFHQKIKKILLNELNCKIYYATKIQEGLDLLRKKKYNKVIIITNGNNNGKYFINKARKIIKANPICAVSAYNIKKHIKWVKEMRNVLILNGIYFHEQFFKYAINNDKDSLNQLRKEIINYYNYIEDFNLKEFDNDLFLYPCFKSSGKFEELDFTPSTNSRVNTAKKATKKVSKIEENDSNEDKINDFLVKDIKNPKKTIEWDIKTKNIIFNENKYLTIENRILRRCPTTVYNYSTTNIFKKNNIIEGGYKTENNNYSTNINAKNNKDNIGFIYYYMIKGSNEGRIWGDDIFTNDSNIAKAAVYSGKCKFGEGKIVGIKIIEGKSSYKSSYKNGIYSNSFGACNSSYIFI